MYIENVDQLSADSFLQRDIYDELIAIENDYERTLIANKLRARAKQVQQTKTFDQNYSAAQRQLAKFQKQEILNNALFSGDMLTDFSLLDEEQQLRCGNWVADDDGVRIQTDQGLQYACPHPIYVNRILRNIETGKYKAELVYKLRNKKLKVFTNRETIATPSKILKLADDGIQVTSLNAPALVKYLSDLESLNPELIKEGISTSKLGWVNTITTDGDRIKQFLPYQSSVVFDSELQYKSLFDSIKTHGSEDEWYKHIRKLREKRQPEFLINLAASFSSVLIEPVGILPFIVSLWGSTGIGKSVILKVCASVWADPAEGKYISNPKATYTAMEIRMDLLNSLPMMLDDIAQVQNQFDENYSQLIYYWCSGQGRPRSNKELGLNRIASWRCCTITNGERSLVDESTQGGAINRVIDIEASGGVLFDGKSGGKTCKVVENNYGWAGEAFVYNVLETGFDYVTRVFNDFYEKLKDAAAQLGTEKEEKQVVPMALILTADYLSEKWLFNDGILIDIEQALGYLRNKGETSEEERAYEYLISTIMANSFRFNQDNENHSETWGFWYKENYIAIYCNRFDEIIRAGGFQSKAFLSWAKKKDLLDVTDDRNKKKINRNFFSGYAYVIRTDYLGGDADIGITMEELEKLLPFE